MGNDPFHSKSNDNKTTTKPTIKVDPWLEKTNTYNENSWKQFGMTNERSQSFSTDLNSSLLSKFYVFL